MIKKITYLIIFLSTIGLIYSCCGLHTEIDYQFNGVNIKRIDVCGKSMFYYNKIGKEKINGLIWTNYSGINDGFKGYLVFQDDSKVLLLSSDGYFQSKDMDTKLFEYKRMLSPKDKPDLSENVYIIMLSTRYEKEFNDTTGTRVNAKYIIDENEWW